MSSKETEGVSSRTKFTSVFETLVILIGLIYRWSIALHPYSGQGKEPMFGDYEAQRHWMEITFNLPIKEWYVNSTRNDLNYWGLDYPPLTAYHSYVMGYIANIVDESYVKLSDSRGIENNQHKLFMRMSVLISDLVVFLPAVLLITRKLVKSSTNDYLILLLLVLLNPTLTLVDYGHFQYNSVSLGLMLLALYFILSLDKQPLCKIKLSIASVFFTLALNYKQMELYHALPFFFFLLGSSLFRSTSISNGLYKLIVIGSSVLLTFLIVWLPFILSQSALDVLKRLFPFDRGLYEDKVANLWCSLSPVYKLKELYSIATLRNICTITTLGAVVPSSVDLFFRPSRQRFLFALVNSALVFFLFSYHVHEKSILLATVPALFLINFYPAIVTWFIFIANFSMLPLLHKDGLFTAFVSTTAVFIAIAYLYYNSNSSNDKQQQRREIGFWPNFKQLALFQVTFKSLFYLSMVASVALTFGFLFVRPPKNLPDLWPLLISVFSFVHFVAFSLLFHWTQFTLVYDDLSSKKQPTLMDFSSQLSSKPKQKNL